MRDLRKPTGKRPFVITRACYAGSQKYSTVWTGDNQSLWSHLRWRFHSCAILDMSGLHLRERMSVDLVRTVRRNLMCRWVQVGAFSPLFRNHSSTGSHFRSRGSSGIRRSTSTANLWNCVIVTSIPVRSVRASVRLNRTADYASTGVSL